MLNSIKAKIKNKKIYPFDNILWDYLMRFFNDKEVEITIKDWKEVRTSAQNRLYWKYLSIIEWETGNDKDEIHELFKRIFLSPRTIKTFGYEIKIPGTTTQLNKKEFSIYLEKIEKLTGIPIPQQWKDELNNN